MTRIFKQLQKTSKQAVIWLQANNLGGSISPQTRMATMFFSQFFKSFPYQHITEHAYFLDYGTDKAAYIKRFIDNIPWDVIDKRAGVII
ncbi:MAG: Fe-Mn family superoxide dismutase [Defluviitaleaceae bacterium]|nr:Fe-Mn family superoxide dismutase [Defluviitaleaceae bacterium]